MTPLAHEMMRRRIANDFSKLGSINAGGRTSPDFPDPYEHLKDVHFFEASAVFELAASMTFNSLISASQVLAFLPAPKTWIEYRVPGEAGRLAFRLVQTEENVAAVEMFIGHDNGRIASCGYGMSMPLVGRPELLNHNVYIKRDSWANERGDNQKGLVIANTLYALLALINSPKLIGQRTHQPHRGLERALLRDRDFAVGKFALHAWKEIRLEVQPPKQAGDTEQEAHFTGRRAYHFVRQYLRMQGGQLVLVSSHWKGDPALGIERSRYTVVPGQKAA